MIRQVRQEDAEDIALIYNYFVVNTAITFETEEVSVGEMQGRIAEISLHYPFLVNEEGGRITGYCYVSKWKKKEAYRSTVESTIYIKPEARGKGLGQELMTVLIAELRKTNIHAVIACITIPNPESVRLHEKLGFRKVSDFKEVGYKFGRWLDVGDWELIV